MPINGDIYNKGIHGELSYEEIESLPRNYELVKQFFHDANNLKNKNMKTMEKTTNLLTYKLNDNETIVVNLVTSTEDEQKIDETIEETVTDEEAFDDDAIEENVPNEETVETTVKTETVETNATIENLLDKFIQRKNDMLVKYGKQ